MISNNNNNLNLSYHPPNPCLLLLPRSLMLSLPPSLMRSRSIYIVLLAVKLFSDYVDRTSLNVLLTFPYYVSSES